MANNKVAWVRGVPISERERLLCLGMKLQCDLDANLCLKYDFINLAKKIRDGNRRRKAEVS